MPSPNFTRRTKIGLILIYLAGLGWAAEFVIPFLKIDHKGSIWVAVLIVAEILFVAGVATLGKPAYHQLKHQLLEYIRRRGQ